MGFAAAAAAAELRVMNQNWFGSIGPISCAPLIFWLQSRPCRAVFMLPVICGDNLSRLRLVMSQSFSTASLFCVCYSLERVSMSESLTASLDLCWSRVVCTTVYCIRVRLFRNYYRYVFL